jgi:hydroxylaminobenzene mutase
MDTMPLLSQLGIYELAVGVLSGWLMVMTIEKPELLRRAGARHLGRIRQAHLDLLMQGVILIAVGLAVDPLPTWIGFLLVLGAFLAPLLLGVLAFDSELQKGSRFYRGVNTVVLVGFTIGWVALAITAAGR